MLSISRKKILGEYFGSYLGVILLVVISAIFLHIFWQLVSLKIGTDNRIINDITNRFGLDEELSFPTWVNSMMAFLVAGLAWIVGKSQKTSIQKITWYLIALIGILISVDEVVALHELLLQGLHILANFGEGQGLFTNAWILVMPAILVGLIFGVRLLYKHLPSSTFKRLVVAIAVYLIGAFIVEYASIPLDKSSALYNFGAVVVEESLELLGVWLAIRAILLHTVEHEKVLSKKIADIIT